MTKSASSKPLLAVYKFIFSPSDFSVQSFKIGWPEFFEITEFARSIYFGYFDSFVQD